MSDPHAGQGTLYGVPIGVMIPRYYSESKPAEAETVYGPVPLPGSGTMHDSLRRMDVAIHHLFDSKGS